MNKKFFVFLFIIVMAVVLLINFTPWKMGGKLVSPNSEKMTNTADLPAPSSPPKSFQFEASTNLKKELENVNPQVLESDFDELRNLTSNL